MADKKLGRVSHYYDNIGVAVVDLTGSLAEGDEVKIGGKSEMFTQTVTSMEIEHKKIKKAKKGQSLGIKVDQPAKRGDLVYKVVS